MKMYFPCFRVFRGLYFLTQEILPHCFYADFTVFDKIILEIKSNETGIALEMFAQTINYLKASGLKVGLIINFGKLKIDARRVIF